MTNGPRELQGNEQHAVHEMEYVVKVVQNVGDGLIGLMDKTLVPSASTGELKVFDGKMKRDYHRYLAEFVASEDKSVIAEGECEASQNHERQEGEQRTKIEGPRSRVGRGKPGKVGGDLVGPGQGVHDRGSGVEVSQESSPGPAR